MTRTAADIGAGLGIGEGRPTHSLARAHSRGRRGRRGRFPAAALLAHHAGAVATACYLGAPSPYTAALAAAGIEVEPRHDAAHVSGNERLAVTKVLTAVHPDHPQLLAARAAGLAIEPWQQLVADAAATSGQRLVAVAGTHGKSTTTGWLVDLSDPRRQESLGVCRCLDGHVRDGRRSGTARAGAPATRSWSRPMSTPATSIRPPAVR